MGNFYGWSSIWVLYFLVIRVKTDDTVTYIKFLSAIKAFFFFFWYEFWKNIFCGKSYVALGVLMTNILNNIPLAKVLLLFLWHLSLELSQPLIYSGGKKWNVSFTFPWTRKKWTVAIHLMNFGRLSDMSQCRLQEYYNSSR